MIIIIEFFFRIRTSEFISLKIEIQELFLKEDISIWYSVSYRNSQNESVSASGKLYRCYVSSRDLFFECGLLNDETETNTAQPGN